MFTASASNLAGGSNAETRFGDLAAEAIVAEKVSDAERPLVSVAFTPMLSFEAVIGAVPVNVSVAALKVSHEGSAEPVASVAL